MGSLSVDYLYKFSLALIKKNNAGGLTATEFGFHWNDAQATYMDDLLGRFQARNNGKEGQNTGLIQNETILTKLTPFTTPATLVVTSGQATKPPDFLYSLALRVNNAPVFDVNKDSIWAVLDDAIDPPSVANNCYYYTEYLGYYSILPATVTSVDLDYVAKPTDVVWGFIVSGTGRQTYDPTPSVQSQWDDQSNREITKRMLTNIGVAYKDRDYAGFGKSVQTTGE